MIQCAGTLANPRPRAQIHHNTPNTKSTFAFNQSGAFPTLPAGFTDEAKGWDELDAEIDASWNELSPPDEATQPADGSSSHYRLICKNLDPTIDKRKFSLYFAKFDGFDPRSVSVRWSGKSNKLKNGFVGFKTTEQANNAMQAMNGVMLRSRRITVRALGPKREPGSNPAAPRMNNTNSNPPLVNTPFKKAPPPSYNRFYPQSSTFNSVFPQRLNSNNSGSPWVSNGSPQRDGLVQPTPTAYQPGTQWKRKEKEEATFVLDTGGRDPIEKPIASVEVKSGHSSGDATAGPSKSAIQGSEEGKRRARKRPTALSMMGGDFADEADDGSVGVDREQDRGQMFGAGGEVPNPSPGSVKESRDNWAGKWNNEHRNAAGASGGVMLGVKQGAFPRQPGYANGRSAGPPFGVDNKSAAPSQITEGQWTKWKGKAFNETRGSGPLMFQVSGVTPQHADQGNGGQRFAQGGDPTQGHAYQSTNGNTQPQFQPKNLLNFRSPGAALPDIDSEMCVDEEMPSAGAPAFPVHVANQPLSQSAPENYLRNNPPANPWPPSTDPNSHLKSKFLKPSSVEAATPVHGSALSPFSSAPKIYPRNNPFVNPSASGIVKSSADSAGSGVPSLLSSFSKKKKGLANKLAPSHPETPVGEASTPVTTPTFWAETTLPRPEGLTPAKPAVAPAPPFVPPPVSLEDTGRTSSWPASSTESDSSQAPRSTSFNPLFSFSFSPSSTTARPKSLADAPPLQSGTASNPAYSEKVEVPKPLRGPSYFDAIIAIEDARERMRREKAKRGPLARRGSFKCVTARKRSRGSSEGAEGPRKWRRTVGESRPPIILAVPAQREHNGLNTGRRSLKCQWEEDDDVVNSQDLPSRATKRQRRYHLPGVIGQGSTYLQYRRSSLPFIEVYNPLSRGKLGPETSSKIDTFDRRLFGESLREYGFGDEGGLAQDLGFIAYEMTKIGGTWLLGLAKKVL